MTYQYETEELWAQRDGNQIYGIVYIPRDAGEQMPAVIYSHGFGGTHRAGEDYAKALARRGYVVYCFDFCGGAPGSRSDGSTLEMSVFTEQADLEAVMDMVRGLDYVDSENVFLMGTSQGGAVSAITAAEHQEEVAGLILLYPAFILADTAGELFESAQDIPETYHFLWMDVGRAYFEPLIGYDIYGNIKGYKKDVLLLHGDADQIVPLSSSTKAVDVYDFAEFHVFPGAGHGFYGEDLAKAQGMILDYLAAHRR